MLVVRRVSFSFPQVVPASAFRLLVFFMIFSLSLVAWDLKLSIGFRGTPRIQGSFTVCTGQLLI